jgi:restriction system protein
MPRNGDGSNEDGEIEKLRSQVRTLEHRLAAFEKSEIPSLKAHLKEHAEEKRRNEEGQREAAEQTELVERQVKAPNAILRSALKGRPLAFDDLKDPQDLAAPERVGPSLSDRLLHGRAAHERVQRQYESDLAQHKLLMKKAADQNAAGEQQRNAFAAGDQAAVEWFVSHVLSRSSYPEKFPRDHRVPYQPESGAVAVELTLPPPEIVPRTGEYLYQSPGVTRAIQRPDSAVRQQYKRVTASIALRALYEIFAATSAHPAVVRVVRISGCAQGGKKLSARRGPPQLVHLTASRDAFAGIRLADVHPADCLTRTLGGQLSPYPLGLLPIESAHE